MPKKCPFPRGRRARTKNRRSVSREINDSEPSSHTWIASSEPNGVKVHRPHGGSEDRFPKSNPNAQDAGAGKPSGNHTNWKKEGKHHPVRAPGTRPVVPGSAQPSPHRGYKRANPTGLLSCVVSRPETNVPPKNRPRRRCLAPENPTGSMLAEILRGIRPVPIAPFGRACSNFRKPALRN